MGLFGKGKSGGMMNVIRCDEEEYLVWKWRPLGQDVNSTSRENAIRYGSSLRVKDGELAVFMYKQKDGTLQDFIVGPYDDTIKTANFPVLSSIVGLAFGGESPFQAEIYFINLQGNNQVRFSIPYFDVTDPRLPDHPIPVSVQGTLTFYLEDYRAFIKLNRLINFSRPLVISSNRLLLVMAIFCCCRYRAKTESAGIHCSVLSCCSACIIVSALRLKGKNKRQKAKRINIIGK